MPKTDIKWVNISHVATDPKEREARTVSNLRSPQGHIPVWDRAGRQGQLTMAFIQGLAAFGFQSGWNGAAGLVKQSRSHCRGVEQRQHFPPSCRRPARRPRNAYRRGVLTALSYHLLLNLGRRGELSSCCETPSYPNWWCCQELRWSSWDGELRAHNWPSWNLLGTAILGACFGQKTAFVQEFLCEIRSLRWNFFPGRRIARSFEGDGAPRVWRKATVAGGVARGIIPDWRCPQLLLSRRQQQKGFFNLST